MRNPRVVSMEWNKKAMFWGKDIELMIKTFEMSDECPTAIIEIWEDERKVPSKAILSVETILDKDENEIKITLDFPLRDMSAFEEDDDYRVYAAVTIEQWGMHLKQEEENYLLISDDF